MNVDYSESLKCVNIINRICGYQERYLYVSKYGRKSKSVSYEERLQSPISTTDKAKAEFQEFYVNIYISQIMYFIILCADSS